MPRPILGLLLLSGVVVMATSPAVAATVAPSPNVTSRVNVRGRPSGRIVGELRPGTEAELLSADGDWFKVRLADGTEGYVSKTWAQVRETTVTTIIPRSVTTTTAGALDDLWSHPQFQTLVGYLWAAPLAILGIVLAVVGVLGWGAFSELRAKLERDVGAILHNRIQLGLGVTFNTLGKTYWESACALDGVQDEDFPPTLGQHATAHIDAAKKLFDLAVKYCETVPRGFEDGRISKEALVLQARQGWAYCVATAPKITTPEEWTRALNYSRDALEEVFARRVLTDQQFERWAHLWVDTFLYVRVVYARPRQPFEGAELVAARHEFNEAMVIYQNLRGDARYESTLARFEPYLRGAPDRKSSRILRSLRALWKR